MSRASAAAVGIYTVAHMTGLDKKVKEYGSEVIKNGMNYINYLAMKHALR